MKETKYDLIIAGGGLSGLLAANWVAEKGYQVLVIEKSKTLGGRAESKTIQEAIFNQGAHALYNGASLKPVLQKWNIPLQGGIPNASKGNYFQANNLLEPFPLDPLSWLKTEHFQGKKKIKLLTSFLRLMSVNPKNWMEQPLQKWLATIQEPIIRSFVRKMMMVSNYSDNVEEASAGVALLQTQKAIRRNVTYLDEGWGGIISHLEKRAVRLGVAFQTKTNLSELLFETKGEEMVCKGVSVQTSLQTKSIFANNVLLTLPPKTVEKLLPSSPCFGDLRAYCNQTKPLLVSCYDFLWEKLPNPRIGFVVNSDFPYYFSVHTNKAKLGASGKHVVHVMKYGECQNPEETRQELEDWLETFQPRWKETCLYKRFLPHMVVSHHSPTFQGKAWEERCNEWIPGVVGFYLSGDWIGKHPQLLADASCESTKQASFRIISNLNTALQKR